jgi:hypothetical protein
MPRAFLRWQKETVTSNSGRCALAERAKSKSWMGPKSNLDRVGGVFCTIRINTQKLNTLVLPIVFHSSPSSAYLVSVKQCRQRNRVGHIHFCIAVTICSVAIRHSPSGKFKQNVIP